MRSPKSQVVEEDPSCEREPVCLRQTPAEPLPATGRFRMAEAVAVAAPSRLRELLARASQPRVISFALGLPAEELFPARELARAQARLLPRRPAVLQYAAPGTVLKSQIVDLMAARGVACSVEQVFLTSGAQPSSVGAPRLQEEGTAGGAVRVRKCSRRPGKSAVSWATVVSLSKKVMQGPTTRPRDLFLAALAFEDGAQRRRRAGGGQGRAAIHFLARVNDSLGLHVPVAAFTELPTFGHLVELARAARPEPLPAVAIPDEAERPKEPDLIVWRGTGSRTPLFLAAPAAGSSLCYRHLAALLGEEQPCYGIESPGLHDDAEPRDRIEDIAAHHVRVVRRVRPHGPYALGGWSTGAMVAHEMVRQLARQGEAVELLILIDGYPPDSRGRPLVLIPEYLLFGVWHRIQAFTRSGWATGLKKSLRLNTGERSSRQMATGRVHTMNEVIQGIGDLGSGAPDFVRVYEASVRAMLRYIPRPAPCRAVLFKTGLSARRLAGLERRLVPLYERGVEVRAAPGNHWTVLDRHHAEELAARLHDLGAGSSIPSAVVRTQAA